MLQHIHHRLPQATKNRHLLKVLKKMLFVAAGIPQGEVPQRRAVIGVSRMDQREVEEREILERLVWI